MPSTSGRAGLEHATAVHAGGVVALRDASLLAEPGELLAVVGPSGSGKSTLLRVIAGLMPLQSGRVMIDDEYTVELPERRGVAMVFEDRHLLSFLTVAENLSFPLDVRHVPQAEAAALVEDQARGLRLTRLLPRQAATLSFGERARVGIGRALVRAPRAFLLDEPLAHLDAAERDRLRRHIADLVRRGGVTTLWVTHDQSEAMAIGDRVAVLRDGEVVQVAPPRQLYNEPVDTFAAEFIGATPMGLMPVRVVVAGAMAGYQLGTRILPTWSALPSGLQAYRDRTVLLGLRAEDVYEHPQPNHGTVTGVVTTVELIGQHAAVGILVGEHRINARFDRRTSVRPGATVTVGVDAARAHIFDPVTKSALAHPDR